MSSSILVFLSIWFSLASLLSALTDPPCVHSPDVPALLAFKDAIVSDPLHILSTWKLPSPFNCTIDAAPCTAWTGITCLSRRVVHIHLSGSQLAGSISPSLGQLPFLRSLNLSHNRLTGGIPMQLGNCSSLIRLDLSYNPLESRIPPELGMLYQLQFLHLRQNNLTGAVPGALANCSTLKVLELCSNQLSGAIPVELRRLSKLQSLSLQNNIFTGSVPSALANCTALTFLALFSNELAGPIPEELGSLSNLQFLGLWDNLLTGVLPNALGNCTALIIVEFSLNRLSGSIPEEWGKLNMLRILFMDQNMLTGILPNLANCTALTEVQLDSNQLSGSIPEELGVLPQLTCLHLGNNKLTGGVPPLLGNGTTLTDLDLSRNELSGSIPTELGFSSTLHRLALGGNHLTGSLPPTLPNCTALQFLDVSWNSLSGTIPDVFNNLSWLGVIDFSYNSLTGPLPRTLRALQRLFRVSLQENALVGTIPQVFLSSRNLNYVTISRNNLSGSIPESLGMLLELVRLDLSHNSLTEQLPLSLGSLTQLTHLDFSWNGLSGSIPSDLGNAVELQSLNLSHNNFTGTLPSSFASLRSIVRLDLSSNQLHGRVPNAFPYDNATLVDLGANPWLCGPIVKRGCNAIGEGSVGTQSSSHLKSVVLVVIASVSVGLLIFGIVICWPLGNRFEYGKRSEKVVNDSFETIHARVSEKELRVATDDFSEDNIIGRGGASSVYKGILVGLDVPVAVKVLKMGQTVTEDQVARLKREVEVLALVRHRNIVKVLGCCFNLETQAIILELMPNSSLDTYLHGATRRNVPSKEEKLRLLRGIAEGLEYLHYWHDTGRSIVHCDLKPANILLDEDWEPRIADFGIAKLVEQPSKDAPLAEQSASMLVRGSIGYIPPEYAFRGTVNTAGDVYSFGVLMLEVLTGRRPTDVASASGGRHETLMSWVQAAYPERVLDLFGGSTPGLTADEAAALAGIALSCTSRNPQQRPTMRRVAKFFTP